MKLYKCKSELLRLVVQIDLYVLPCHILQWTGMHRKPSDESPLDVSFPEEDFHLGRGLRETSVQHYLHFL